MPSGFLESPTGLEHRILVSQAGAAGGLGVQGGHEPPYRQEFGMGLLHNGRVVPVTGTGAVVQVVEPEEVGATVEVVGLGEGWAGLEMTATGNAESKPRMARSMAAA